MYLQKDFTFLIKTGSDILDFSQYFLKFNNTVYENGYTIFTVDTILSSVDLEEILIIKDDTLILKRSFICSTELHFSLKYASDLNLNLLNFLSTFVPVNTVYSLKSLKTTSFITSENSIIVFNYKPMENDLILDLSAPLPLSKIKLYFFYKFMKDLFQNKLNLPLRKIYYYYDTNGNIRFRLDSSKLIVRFLQYYSTLNINYDKQYFPEILCFIKYNYEKIHLINFVNTYAQNNSLIYYFNNKSFCFYSV